MVQTTRRLSEWLELEEWLPVRRSLSATPLAKAHARFLAGAKPRARRAIPWTSFRRDLYPEAALVLACDQAQKLAEGEYAAIALFGQIASGLAMTRAPFDIVSAAAAIGGDEIRHADYCTQYAELCAGRELELQVAKHEVRAACSDLYEIENVDFFLLKYSAIGETLAAVLLHECQRGAKDPVARALYRSIAGDEVHHARLGWYYFAWRAPQWSLGEKQRLADRIAEFVVELEHTFWVGRDAEAGAIEAAKALGVLDSERQRAAIASVMNDEIVPALDAIGLGGTHLWSARRPGNARRPGTEVTGSRPGPELESAAESAWSASEATDAAAAWLSAAIADDGSLRFAIDPRGEVTDVGLMHHGRAAVALAALEHHAGFAHKTAALRAWLGRELAAAQRGDAVPGFADEEDPVRVGTLALLALAGFSLHEELARAAKAMHVEDPAAVWHGAQAITALGNRVELPALYARCVADLELRPWAPWTARAAHGLGDLATLARCRAALLDELAPSAADPASVRGVLPVAVVAASLEALSATRDGCDETAAERAAIAAGRGFLLRTQCRGPGFSCGAFPIATSDPNLRSDVTAHALLALLATRT